MIPGLDGKGRGKKKRVAKKLTRTKERRINEDKNNLSDLAKITNWFQNPKDTTQPPQATPQPHNQSEDLRNETLFELIIDRDNEGDPAPSEEQLISEGNEPLPDPESALDESVTMGIDEIIHANRNAEGEETPLKTRVVMWNCGGIGDGKNWGPLRQIIESFQTEIVILVEIKCTVRNFSKIAAKLPSNFLWTVEGGDGKSKGVAIGVRRTKTPIFQNVCTIVSKQAIQLDINMGGHDWTIVAIYRHANTGLDYFCKKIEEGVRNHPRCIIAGDWNVSPTSKEWERVGKLLTKTKTERAQWDLPTHAKGSCIDHLFVSQETALDNHVDIAFTPSHPISKEGPFHHDRFDWTQRQPAEDASHTRELLREPRHNQ